MRFGRAGGMGVGVGVGVRIEWASEGWAGGKAWSGGGGCLE